MAVPKRRHSKSRSRKRRTNQGLKAPNLVVCPQCKERKKPHCVCANCGYYKGRPVVNLKEKK
jgi:large subunit ribosomal protein L32